MPRRKQDRRSVSMKPDFFADVKSFIEATGETMAGLVERVVSDYMARERQNWADARRTLDDYTAEDVKVTSASAAAVIDSEVIR